jgi:hypothetical protein
VEVTLRTWVWGQATEAKNMGGTATSPEAQEAPRQCGGTALVKVDSGEVVSVHAGRGAKRSEGRDEPISHGSCNRL